MTGTLRFEPNHAVRHVVLVGCGGTGSHWARSIARIVYDMRRRGHHIPRVTFVDPDTVEEANVGRQMYTEADVGEHKAGLLARRFNHALGLSIEWIDEPFDPERHIERYGTLLCGAVDNHLARRALAAADCLWIDAGNHFDSGQVVVGNTGDRERVLRALETVAEDGAISVLPDAALVFPELLEPAADSLPQEQDLSCAELVEAGQQHLLINDLVATVAAQITYRLLYRQPLHSSLTFATLDVVRPVPITSEELAVCLS